MIEISKNANENYLAKIIRVRELVPIEGANNIQTTSVDFQEVVISNDVSQGDIMVYFPIEFAINLDYLNYTNSFSDIKMNKDENALPGFFGKKGRVKAVRLMKGKVRSMGYLVPIADIKSFFGEFDHDEYINMFFDTINGVLIGKKYVVPSKTEGNGNKQGKKPKVSRLIDGQTHFHIKTPNFRHNVININPMDEITITRKTHGTSFWVSNVLVKRKLSFVEKVLVKLGVNISDTEYDYVYGSRRVVKNDNLDDPKKHDHFYKSDIWGEIKEELKEHIPKGFTLYGEALGFTKTGEAIQKGFDYGCAVGYHKEEIYRITQTTADGFVTELSSNEIIEFCNKSGLTPSKELFKGRGMWQRPEVDINLPNWSTLFIESLEKEYLEKDAWDCRPTVPDEGIVIRVEGLFSYEVYKLKSFRFLEHEGHVLDKGESDLESEN